MFNFKLHHGNKPSILSNQFQINNVTRLHNTRISSQSYPVSGLASSNFVFYCIRICNTVYNKTILIYHSKLYITNHDINLHRF